MGCFAAGPTKLGEGVRSCLARAIERVEEVYRGPATCALVSEEGELRYQSEGGCGIDVATLANLCALKRASLGVRDGFDARSVPAMHVRGDGRVVSLFDAGKAHALVVTAEMHPTSAELFDGVGAEASMRDVLEALGDALETG